VRGATPTHDLSRLLRPRTIAVIGGKPAAEVVRQNQRMGYQGEIWPIHPKADSVAGVPAFRSLSDLPGVPDAVFLAVNRHATIDYVRAFAAIGAGGAVSYAAGFAETGAEGEALQAALRTAAGDMPVLGPNCYGLINYLDGALLWPDQHGGQRVERGVAIVTQSGNIGCNLTMQTRGLPIAYLVTMGNQAVVGLSAAVATLASDPRVTAIGLHIEGIDDAAAFAGAVAQARAHGKPVVALKTGSSATGAQLTVSHTASLSGADSVVAAYFRRIGVARVHTLPVLLETLKLLHLFGPFSGRDIASMSCSGGEATLIADRAERHGVRFRALDDRQKRAVAATLSDLVTVTNPLDYNTFSWANGPALTATFTAMMACGFDLTALILDYPRIAVCDETDWLIASDALIAASRATGRPAAVLATLPECMSDTRARELMAQGVAPLSGMDEALAAIDAAMHAGIAPAAMPPLTDRTPSGGPLMLDEVASKTALAAHGVRTPAGRVVATPSAAATAAAELGFPVVLKAVSATMAHKSERGAVRLNLSDAAAVRDAAAGLLPLGEALLVERMVTDAVAEVIVGVNRDPAIGPYLVLGSGGVLVELVGDSATLLLPATDADIRDALAGLKVARLLAGFRGRPAGDMTSLVACVLAVQSYAIANLDRLLELDVNPVMVRPLGLGAVAVDAMIRLVETCR
jgi:acetate---CoA ligase (ADP-forming)